MQLLAAVVLRYNVSNFTGPLLIYSDRRFGWDLQLRMDEGHLEWLSELNSTSSALVVGLLSSLPWGTDREYP